MGFSVDSCVSRASEVLEQLPETLGLVKVRYLFKR